MIGLPSLPGLSGGSLSGMAVFHNTIQILMGTTAQNLQDVTSFFPPMSLLSIHYEDPISFQADTLELTFADIGDQIIKSASGLGSTGLTLKKGNWIKVKIDQWNRDYPGSHVQKDLGSFQIDQIKDRWPPTQVTLMASSVPISEQIKFTLQNKTRFTVTLKDLAQTVAKENHLGFLWDITPSSPAGQRAEARFMSSAQQWNESDLTMLSRYLRENALSYKIKDINGTQTLVVFDEQDLEKKPPVYTIDFSAPGAGIALERGELTTQSQDIYAGSQLAWFDSYSNQLYVGVADAPPETADGSGANLVSHGDRGQVQKDGSGTDVSDPDPDPTSRKVSPRGDEPPQDPGANQSSLDDTAQMAQMLLRAKNIKEYHSVLTTAGSLTFPNGVAIDSGVVVAFKNKGVFDGNWIVQKYTIHLVESKLMSELEFRKCLDFTQISPKNIKYVVQPSSDPDPDAPYLEGAA